MPSPSPNPRRNRGTPIRRSCRFVPTSTDRRDHDPLRGSPGGLDGPLRHLVSLGLRLLTKVLFPERLRGVTDPLGGFFLVRRSLVQGVELHPMGYKILLEILVRSPWQTIAEVPYEFRPRRGGTSKANLREGLRFLSHVAALRRR